MLNQVTLKMHLADAFKDVIKPAAKCAWKSTLDAESAYGDNQAEQFADTFTEMIAEPLAERLAAAIDYYIKSGCIYGNIVTAGTPVTQTAIIPPGVNLGNPVAGKVPNTFGIL